MVLDAVSRESLLWGGGDSSESSAPASPNQRGRVFGRMLYTAVVVFDGVGRGSFLRWELLVALICLAMRYA